MNRKQKNRQKYSKKNNIKKALIGLTLGLGIAAISGVLYYSHKNNQPVNNQPVVLQKELNSSNIVKLDDVVLFDSYKENPQVVFIPQKHPLKALLTDFDSKEGSKSITDISRICNQLYSEYGVDTLLFEGIGKSATRRHNNGSYLRIGHSENWPYFKKLEILLNKDHWNLISGESRDIDKAIAKEEEPIRDIQKRYKHEYDKIIVDLMNKYLVFDKNGDCYLPKEKKKEFEEAGEGASKVLKERFGKKFRDELKEVLNKEKLQKLYDLMVTQRDKNYLNAIKEHLDINNTPVILVHGTAHVKSLTELLKEEGISYAVLKPKDYPFVLGSEFSAENIASQYHLAPRSGWAEVRTTNLGDRIELKKY